MSDNTATISEQDKQAYSDISIRIKDLSDLTGEDLTNEMSVLKKALLDNPAAVILMLPEEIGAMVTALQKITGKALATAAAAKKKPSTTKAPKLTAAEMAAAADDL